MWSIWLSRTAYSLCSSYAIQALFIERIDTWWKRFLLLNGSQSTTANIIARASDFDVALKKIIRKKNGKVALLWQPPVFDDYETHSYSQCFQPVDWTTFYDESVPDL